MTRRAGAALATTVAIALAFTGCTQPAPTTLSATGRVVADTLSVQAPTLGVPRVSLDAGFQLAPGQAATSSNVPAVLSLGAAQRVVAVAVKLGDSVEAGDVLVRFDDAGLGAQVKIARADLAVTKAQVGVIDSALETLADKQRDLRDKRREVTDGIAKATRARKDLAGKLADARKAAAKLPKTLATVEQNLRMLTPKLAEVEKNLRMLTPKLVEVEQKLRTLTANLAEVEKKLGTLRTSLAEVEKQLAQVDAALAALPPDAPPEVRDQLLQAKARLTAAKAELTTGIAKLTAARAELKAGIAELTAARAQLKAGIAKLTAAKAQLKAGIAKLTAARTKLSAAIRQLKKGIPQLTKAIRTIDANLVKARDGIRQIDKGLNKLADARATLKGNRKLAVIAARDTTAVDSASVAKKQAVVRAPTDGVVTSLASVGEVVAPGATVAEVARPARVVTTWLAPEQAAQVCLDASATVHLDSLAAPVAGKVSRILPLAEYPPSYHTTDQVHLTRAVPVEVTVDSPLPPGVPADLQLATCPTHEVNP